jgi:transposase
MIVITGICSGKIMATFCFDDYTNVNRFWVWLEKVLCLKLHPGQIITMDNALFHKSPHIREMIEHAGCSLLYLPRYSLNLNSIGHDSAWLKNQISSLWHYIVWSIGTCASPVR